MVLYMFYHNSLDNTVFTGQIFWLGTHRRRSILGGCHHGRVSLQRCGSSCMGPDWRLCLF
ncbi:hypothetical protein EG68_02607 [Paragonimus skrjabini miyazakii]|uniref:Uncharacterized protein n=1 Tax=Paragonimus skrjabini miyazakii TaxID=59628 RepID=A0A8S9YYE2_9TREM|nr:hypothetical protein EG68_02607 [Paragonimus skrjabini miyazakii]